MKRITAPELTNVVTISEAARIWHKNPTTVRRKLDDYRVHSRMSGRVYLISVASLIKVWGQPLAPFDW